MDQLHTYRTHGRHVLLPLRRLITLLLAVVAMLFFTGCQSGKACCATSEVETEPAEPLQLADAPAYRRLVAKQAINDYFEVKAEPADGDTLLDLMPAGTMPVALINPGFTFTQNGGEPVPPGAWIIVVREGQPGYMQRHGKGIGQSDPIKGWTADGCAGVEATKRFTTMPDGATGYMVAHGKAYTLHQTLPGKLQPNTRYTLMVEVFARKDYQTVKANELILNLTDAERNDLKSVAIDTILKSPGAETGFTVALISITTAADQPDGDLMVHLGFNATGNVRVNYDNVKLWEQKLDD